MDSKPKKKRRDETLADKGNHLDTNPLVAAFEKAAAGEPPPIRFTDGASAAAFASAKRDWEAGSTDGLLRAMVLGVAYGMPAPDWVREPLKDVWRQLNAGNLRDLNEAFDWQGGHVAKRAAAYRVDTQFLNIMGALIDCRAKGCAMDTVTFDEIAESLATGRRVVQTVWAEAKEAIEECAARGLSPSGIGLRDEWGAL